MAVIAATRVSTPNAYVIGWSNITPADTVTPLTPIREAATLSCLQVVGTFGTATVSFQKSNDGVNWVALNDINNAAISMAATGMAEYKTAALYIRPIITGAGYSLTILFSLRG